MIRTATILFSLALGACYQQAAAFTIPLSSSTVVQSDGIGARQQCVLHQHDGNIETEGSAKKTRRVFVEDLLKGSIGVSLASMASTPAAYASGGATAGGVYLLSAKQRYNARVLAGIKAFLTLDARDLGQVNAYFETSDVGGWEDASAAGYLLANAFRTSSSKPPDTLPAVKKWKSFAKNIELLKRALAKKDGDKVLTAYNNAVETLDAYLEEVELPSSMELKKM